SKKDIDVANKKEEKEIKKKEKKKKEKKEKESKSNRKKKKSNESVAIVILHGIGSFFKFIGKILTGLVKIIGKLISGFFKLPLVGKIISLVIIALLVFGCIYFLVIEPANRERDKVNVSSAITKILPKSEIQAAVTPYDGVVIMDLENGNKQYIKYETETRLTYDFSQIHVWVDDSTRTLNIALPEIVYQEPSINESQMEFLPKNANISIKDAMDACVEDAKSKTKDNKGMYEIAKANTRKALEAIVEPYTKERNLTVRWANDN
ncbi:MAG: DUF4230 domain-containing protein, partial [Enterococcus sp.]|nr:DUF4230 domain-containing protein [Enterococcus sp.]